jgi:glucose/arabinose dehydrogenase
MKIFKLMTIVLFTTSLGCHTNITPVVSSPASPLLTVQSESSPTQVQTATSASSTPVVSAITWPAISLSEVIVGLSQPLHIAHAGDGSGRLFIVEKNGRVKVYLNNIYQGIFLDLHSKASTVSEQGLLSVVFPPGYSTSGNFYVNYTNLAGDTVIARYQVSTDPNLADATSEEILLTVDQPYANHNGGQMAFGPDGYLYIGMGDGGSGGDPDNRAQDPGNLLGKILRINVERESISFPPAGSLRAFFPVVLRPGETLAYRIPSDNPFINTPGFRPEIWALGVRNPWRFSFDRVNGSLYIADVGQNEWEEVNVQDSTSPGGENYGWRILEGNHCYNPSSNCVPPTGYVAPAFEYAHGVDDANGCSITGGFVYRGNSYPSMQGIYIYGDFCKGNIWGAINNGGWETSLLTIAPFMISTFGEDETGEVYVADYGNGKIYQIQEN